MAGVIGSAIALLNLIMLGSWFKVFTKQTAMFLLLLLFGNLLSFVVAGLCSGILISPYARNTMESLKSGLIAGGLVAFSPILLLVFVAVFGIVKLDTSFSALPLLLGILVSFCILVSQVALAGMISLVYTGYYDRLVSSKAAAGAEEAELGDLKALYDDLWKDARTLAADMNRSILLYLLVGCLMLAYGIIILAYAAASWQQIFSGNPNLADYAAAVGEIIGGLVQLIVGPLLIRWYLKLKSRYARLASMEKGAGE